MAQDQQIDLGYQPRRWQSEVHATRKRYSIWVLHRRAGKTVALVMEAIRTALETDLPNPHVALIYPQRDQARRVAWPMLKDHVRVVPNVQLRESDLQVIFPHNGARISLFGTHDGQYESMRGLYFDLACFDEYAQCDGKAFSQVVRPALADRKGELIMCGTPQGRDKFYEAWIKAGQHPNLWSRFMLKASESGLLDEEELSDSRKQMDEAEYQREYECEFTAMPAGAFYANEIRALRHEGRLTELRPDDGKPVVAAMDVGVNDATVCWFAQVVGTAVHVIDCLVWRDTSLRDVLRDMRAQPYNLVYLGVPHDMGHREQTSNAPKYMTIMDLLPGVQVEVIPRLRVEDGIMLTRQLFTQLKFDRGSCGDGLEFLATYQRKFSRDTQKFLNTPKHDDASDYADALRYLAQLLDILAGGDGSGNGGTIDQTVVSRNRYRPPRVVGTEVRGY